MSRILIKNGTIVSMDRQTGDLHGDLLVENERIAAISPAIEASDAQIIDASTMIVSPGLINSHIHTWETGLRGIAVTGPCRNTYRPCIGVSRPISAPTTST